MSYLRVKIILLFIVSCVAQPYLDNLSSTSEDNSLSRRRRLGRENLRSQSLADQCSNKSSCKTKCDEMYLKASDLDTCYNTREDAVDRVFDVFGVLQNPDTLADLNGIEEDDFQDYMVIGEQSFLDLVDPELDDEDHDRINEDWEDLYSYDADQARLVLEWIAENEEISKTMKNYDDDRSIMRELFTVVGFSLRRSRLPEGQVSSCRGAITNDNCRPQCVRSEVDWDKEMNLDVLLGFSDPFLDQVSFTSYAHASDNDDAVELAIAVRDDICLEVSGTPISSRLPLSKALGCAALYHCLADKYEGGRRQSGTPPYRSAGNHVGSGINGGIGTCSEFIAQSC